MNFEASNKVAAKVAAIILAAGKSTRMQSDIPKPFISVAQDTVLRHTVRAFQASEEIDSIIVVSPSDYLKKIKDQLSDFSKVDAVVVGGESRMASARRGFSAIGEDIDFVAIHDAARCLITPDMINSVVAVAKSFGAATAGCAVYDTVKSVENGEIVGTVSREGLFLAQTPQVFDRVLYAKALVSDLDFDCITDDNMLMETIGVRVKCVNTGPTNVKLTTKLDLDYAEFLLSKRGYE